MIEPISQLWMEHQTKRFPKGYGGLEVNDICVVTIDTYAAGCIYTYVSKNEKSLDLERYQILQRCKVDLERVMSNLDGDALEYFDRLHEMCRLILKEASIT
jgi:hypothetical protein